MLELDVKGFGKITATFLVLDYNGTLALDGKMLPGVRDILMRLAKVFQIIILTADTFGKVNEEVKKLPVEVVILKGSSEDESKKSYVRKLGSAHVIAIGNGRNDALMLEEAAIGIAVIQQEGAASATLQNADMVCSGILDALGLLENPKRIMASLRK